MNSTRGSSPPNPNLDLPNRSTDLNKTLGIIGTPHEEPIAKFNSTQLVQKRGIEEIPPRTPLTLELGKPQNRASLLKDLGGESQPKEPRRKFPPSNPQEKGLKNNPRKTPRKGSENHHQEQPGATQQGHEEPRRIIYTCHRGSYKV
jgi:hypothetical protein